MRKKQTQIGCSMCDESDTCKIKHRRDDGIRKFHCCYCGKDVIVTGVAPCRLGIHFCYERLLEIAAI